MAKDNDKYGKKEIQENIKKFGPLKKKPKKELTLEERQPRKLFPNKKDAVNNMMFARQKKKAAVSGTMKGKQVDTTKGPNMSQVNKPERKRVADNINKKDLKPAPAPKPKAVSGSESFKPTDTKKGPNMSKVNKPEKKENKMDRREMGRALQRKAQASMGFKKGGSVKRNMRDGCAVRGKTKGKMC